MTKDTSVVNHKPLIYQAPSIKNNTLTEQFKTVLSEDEQKKLSQFVSDNLGEEHPFDYAVIEGLMKKFGLVNSVVDKISDYTIGGNIYIESKNQDVVDFLEEWITKSKIKRYIKPWFKEGLSKGNGYMEIAGLGDKTKEVSIKIVNANNMYDKRDKYGNLIGYTQYFGNMNRFNSQDAIELTPEEIVKLNINKLGSGAYGQGIVYAALSTVNDFLLAQKAIHKLTKRKANVPMHWKMGSIEKDDYPQQADIDGFGQKLQYMDETTDYVTGPNVEAKVIDFGNIGDKFSELLKNDYKLMSYCFQVPESIMGSDDSGGGINSGGKIGVQEEGFKKRCASYREELDEILSTQIFDKLLAGNGMEGEIYEICWDVLSDEEKDKRLMSLKEMLNSSGISQGMKMEIEKKIAYMMEIDYESIDPELLKPQAPLAPIPGEVPFGQKKKPIVKKESFIEEGMKGIYRGQHIHEAISNDNVLVSEWIDKDLTNYKENILKALDEYKFSDLKADSRKEESMGYLTKGKITILKQIYKDAILTNKGVNDIKKDIIEKVKLKDLLVGEKIRMNKDSRADMIAKTELTRILNMGLVKQYEANNGDKPILLQYNAILDAVTCPICEGLDGQIFDGDTMSQDEVPPIHPFCRCSLNEVTGTEKLHIDKVNSIIIDGIDEGKAPQEIELELTRIGVTNENANKLIEYYNRLNEVNTK